MYYIWIDKIFRYIIDHLFIIKNQKGKFIFISIKFKQVAFLREYLHFENTKNVLHHRS